MVRPGVKIADNLITKRSNLKKNLERIIAFGVDADPVEMYIEDVHTEIKNANRCLEQLEVLHDQLLAVADDDQKEEMSDVEAEFYKLHRTAVRILKGLLQQNSASSVNSNDHGRAVSSCCGGDHVGSSQVKLPQLDLPKFSGESQDWTAFHDLFVASVDENKSLSGAQKLQYLKASLKGDARNLINSFSLSNVNYKEAWELLCERYDNKKIIIMSHIHSLLHVQCVGDERHGLRRLLDTWLEKLRALKALGEDTDSWDSILVCLVSEKLDPETRKQWELETPTRDMPSFGQLQQFLSRRCMALEAIPTYSAVRTIQRYQQPEEVEAYLTHSDSDSECQCCSNGKHAIYNCYKFKKMNVKTRGEFVRNKHLCFNCLGSGHSSRDCQLDPCSKCSHRHHNLLHFEKHAEGPDSQVNTHVTSQKQVLLAIATGMANDVKSDPQLCRTFLDSG